MLTMIPSPERGQLDIGPIPVRGYGVAIAIGVVVASHLAQRRWSARGGDPSDLPGLVTWSILAGLVGARAYHVVTDLSRFEGRWGDVVKVWEGGLGIPGGLLAGTITGALIARRRGLPAARLLDVAAPAIPIAQAIGRFGNWFNQELYGRPTDLPWALEIDAENRPPDLADVGSFHPTFLYEALWNVALAVALIAYERRRPESRPGRLFALYVGGYAVGRLWVEALRIDPASLIAGIRVNIWVSLLAAASSAAWLAITRPAQGGTSGAVSRTP